MNKVMYHLTTFFIVIASVPVLILLMFFNITELSKKIYKNMASRL